MSEGHALCAHLCARVHARAAQADPEPSIGDYLNSGMATSLGRAHARLQLAPFRPMHKGKPNEQPRETKGVIARKFFNARHSACKRIVLSSEFQPIFSEKTQAMIRFVPPGDEELTCNERNAAMAHFAALRSGTAARAVPVFPDEQGAADQENSQQEPPRATQPPAASNVTPRTTQPLAARAVTPSATQLPVAGDDVLNAGSAAAAAELAEAEELDALDGAELPGDAAAPDGTQLPPKPRGNRKPGDTITITKKGQLAAKRAAAAAKRAEDAAAAAKKRARDFPDSSDEEGSAGADLPAGRRAEPTPTPPSPKKQQAHLKPKLCLAEVALNHAAVTSTAINPPFEPANAATRFVFVPAAEFGAKGIGGWVAKVIKVGKQKDPTVTIQFKDGDDRLEKQCFSFSHVKAAFKPLS